MYHRRFLDQIAHDYCFFGRKFVDDGDGWMDDDHGLMGLIRRLRFDWERSTI